MSNRTRAPKRFTEEEIEDARQLRRDGYTYREISKATGISLEPLSRFLKDVSVPPKPPEPITPGEFQDRVDEARYADRRRNKVTADDDPARPSLKPRLSLPEPGRYPPNNDGTMRQGLIDYADLQLGLYLDAVDAGHLYDQQPMVFLQSWYIYLHSFRPFVKAWFQQSRSMWRRIREGTEHSLDDFAQQIGVSISTVRRWELNERTPDQQDAAKLQQLLVQAQEREIGSTETAIAKRDVFTAEYAVELSGYDLIEGMIGAENLERGDDCLDNGTGYTIDHLPSLKAARELIPYPNHRTPTLTNHWLIGYAEWPGMNV